MQEVRITVPMQDGRVKHSPAALQSAFENVKGIPIVKYIGNTEVPIGFVDSAKVDEAGKEIKFIGHVWSTGISFRELAEEQGDGKRLQISSVNI